MEIILVIGWAWPGPRLLHEEQWQIVVVSQTIWEKKQSLVDASCDVASQTQSLLVAVWIRNAGLDCLLRVLMYSGMQVYSYFRFLAGMEAALRPLVNITCARGAAEKDHWYVCFMVWKWRVDFGALKK